MRKDKDKSPIKQENATCYIQNYNFEYPQRLCEATGGACVHIDFVLLELIRSLSANNSGKCVATNEWLANKCLVSSQQITRMVSKFYDLGLIENIKQKYGWERFLTPKFYDIVRYAARHMTPSELKLYGSKQAVEYLNDSQPDATENDKKAKKKAPKDVKPEPYDSHELATECILFAVGRPYIDKESVSYAIEFLRSKTLKVLPVVNISEQLKKANFKAVRHFCILVLPKFFLSLPPTNQKENNGKYIYQIRSYLQTAFEDWHAQPENAEFVLGCLAQAIIKKSLSGLESLGFNNSEIADLASENTTNMQQAEAILLVAAKKGRVEQTAENRALFDDFIKGYKKVTQAQPTKPTPTNQ